MDANTSNSDSSDVDGNPPPKRMKMGQTTLQFRRVDRTQSSPECHTTASGVSSTADLRTSECESATASSVSSTTDQDLCTGECESATVCFSDCCKEGLSPYLNLA